MPRRQCPRCLTEARYLSAEMHLTEFVAGYDSIATTFVHKPSYCVQGFSDITFTLSRLSYTILIPYPLSPAATYPCRNRSNLSARSEHGDIRLALQLQILRQQSKPPIADLTHNQYTVPRLKPLPNQNHDRAAAEKTPNGQLHDVGAECPPMQRRSLNTIAART